MAVYQQCPRCLPRGKPTSDKKGTLAKQMFKKKGTLLKQQINVQFELHSGEKIYYKNFTHYECTINQNSSCYVQTYFRFIKCHCNFNFRSVLLPVENLFVWTLSFVLYYLLPKKQHECSKTCRKENQFCKTAKIIRSDVKIRGDIQTYGNVWAD